MAGKARAAVRKLYKNAFAPQERMPFWLMTLMAKRKDTQFDAYYAEDSLCALAYLATVNELTFLMFLAVEQSMRSRGYGSAVLEEIERQRPGAKTLVSIERCDAPAGDTEQRLRRRRFYERNGYEQTGYLIEMAKQQQEILIRNGAFEPQEFLAFFRAYGNGTLKPKIWRAEDEAGRER